MLGFINALSSRQKKNGFSFSQIQRDYPVAPMTVSSPPRASSVSLSALSSLDVRASGVSFTARFTNAHWGYGANEMIFAMGNSNNYVYFQKRKTGYKFRWGLVSNGVIILIDEFSIDYLYQGNFTIGASIGADEIIFCVNGVVVSRQTTGLDLPDITSADTIEVGQFFGATQPVNTFVTFDAVHIWGEAL